MYSLSKSTINCKRPLFSQKIIHSDLFLSNKIKNDAWGRPRDSRTAFFKTGWGHPNNQGILVYCYVQGKARASKMYIVIAYTYLKKKVFENIFYSSLTLIKRACQPLSKKGIGGKIQPAEGVGFSRQKRLTLKAR